MSIAQALAAELEYEAAQTRRYLEALPAAKWDWQPHEKSMPLGRLASHLVEINSWVAPTIANDVYEENSATYQIPMADSPAELVAMHDANVKAALEALSTADDARMMGMWKMIWDGNEVLNMPRAQCLRGFIMNHMLHHRGQLGVYLRLLDVPVPALYGNSADENPMAG